MNKEQQRTAFFLCATLSLLPSITSAMGLILGCLFALFAGNPQVEKTRKIIPKLLGWSVVGLGTTANLMTILHVGATGMGYTFVTISLTLAAGALIGRWLSISQNMVWLIGAGTAICGGSAIAAVSSVIRAKEDEISVAMGTVFILNGVALILFPMIGQNAGMSAESFGLWCALAIHDTSSVVGAAMTFGNESLRLATTLKLARALWIFPVAVFIGMLTQRENKTGAKLQVPWFLWGYLGVAAFFTTLPMLGELGSWVTFIAKRAFVLTLFLVGSTLSVSSLKKVGPRPFLMGLILWVLAAALTFFAIQWGWIR